jgi:RNA polymerase sigma-70 factor (ECF subfamily)
MSETIADERELPEDAHLQEVYHRTRKSLIERLSDWQDQKTWDEFYRTYWRLIYSVGVKSGLRGDEAMDLVQEVIVSIAKQTQKQQYDPKLGSFKSWLMNLTRWRINDQFRKRAKDTAMWHGAGHDERDTATFDRFPDERGADLEKVWDAEWARTLLDRAMVKVRTQVSPKQFQIFDCYVIKEWPVGRVKSELGVSMTQVYLAKHRVGKILKQEITNIERQSL